MRKIISFIFLFFISLFSFQVFAEETPPEIPLEVAETPEPETEVAIDITPPTITLVGDALITTMVGTPYTDTGVTANDETDGDITDRIETTGSVDTTIEGDQVITYTVRDTAGNTAETRRTVTVTALSETILIRNGETVIYNGTVPLPLSGNINISDSSGITHTVDARSVLGLLYTLDKTEGSFEITDLAYYATYNSFYLKCLKPTGTSPACDNWQYVVGGTTPWTSMDQTILSGGETIGFYFGNPHQVIFDVITITAGESLAATAQKYNYIDNTWDALTGVTIGVTVPNPDDAWNPVVISEAPVVEDGTASIVIAKSGTYILGIKEDYYFPAYTVIVDPKQETTGGTGTIQRPIQTFDVRKAIDFLISKQNPDGSFSSPLYSDWAAIAFAAGDSTSPNAAKLKTYLIGLQDPGPLVTDSERHTMALMALGADPTVFITKIVAAYDGTQIGDPSLYNDDIFAIFPLIRAGYTPSDPMIQNIIAFILSKQKADGGWGSVDMTAAAVQALTLAGVSEGIEKAKIYLKSSGSENSSSASWILQAIAALGETPSEWESPLDYLMSLQHQDGGVDSGASSDMRVWATAYAIPGALGKTWASLLQPFQRPVIENPVTNTTTPPKNTEIETPLEPEVVLVNEPEPEVPITVEVAVPEEVPVVALASSAVPKKAVEQIYEEPKTELVSVQPQTANALSAWGSFKQTKTAVWLRSAVSRVKSFFSYLFFSLRR